MTIFRYILTLSMISLLAACGGGGGGTSTRTVTLKLSTVEAPLASASVVGVDITMTLPAGVTPGLNPDGSVAATVVAVSGAAVSGTVLPPVYVAENGATKGTLRLTVTSSATSGFNAGEFVTVTLALTGAATPVAGDFVLSGFSPIDILGGVVTGLTAAVSSLIVL